MRLVALVSLAALVACGSTAHEVSVLYAGSLVRPLEGPIAAAARHRGLAFVGESRGSKEIVNLILAGLRKPDVVIVVNPAVAARLQRRGFIARSWPLGETHLELAWSANSRFAALYRRAGGANAALARLLATPHLRIARTDPRLDPKGVYTIAAVRQMVGAARERALLGSDENAAQIFPEESLLVHLESGEADVGFVYSTEAIAHHLQTATLPGVRFAVRYRVAILNAAKHPAAASEFVDFLLRGEGRLMLERYGVERP